MDGRNPIRTTLKPWLKRLFVGICRGIIISGFLNGGAKWISQPSAVARKSSELGQKHSATEPLREQMNQLMEAMFNTHKARGTNFRAVEDVTCTTWWRSSDVNWVPQLGALLDQLFLVGRVPLK